MLAKRCVSAKNPNGKLRLKKLGEKLHSAEKTKGGTSNLRAPASRFSENPS